MECGRRPRNSCHSAVAVATAVIRLRQQTASGESEQNCGGQERKDGHRNLLHVGRNSTVGQKFQP
ncbi:hypothetical protein [Mucilaginibacter gynuensis]|uniref:hypothetical protein n=1 Tax=Mucilaginibacter gynuensis TaxID=1302236 RepID=UPI0031E942B1